MTYKFIGKAGQPLLADTISRQIHCKSFCSLLLPVYNWLSTPQEFEVITKSKKFNKSPYKLSGNSVIDVAGNSSRDYKWTIYVLKEGPIEFEVKNAALKSNGRS